DKLNPFGLKLVERAWHRFDRAGVDIVRENDRARARFPNDAARPDSRARPFPVEWINVPEDDAITKFRVDPFFLSRGDRAIGRPHQDRANADRRPDRFVGLLQLSTNALVPHLAKSRVRPAMIADFMALAHGPQQDLGVFHDISAYDKKSRVDVVLGENV